MKMNLAVIAMLALGLTLFGCSTSGTKTSNVNGNWTASLTDTHGAQVLAFNTTITESSNSSLSVSNFSFSTNSACFVSGETESGTFALRMFSGFRPMSARVNTSYVREWLREDF